MDMRMCAVTRVALAAALSAYALPAAAQQFENVGTRAQGMGGAFVAVADDASASWWNPAGLASGSYFNLVIEKGARTQPDQREPFDPAIKQRASGFAVAFPALGLSYYRLQVTESGPINSIAGNPGGRQNEEEGRGVRLLSVSQFGVTIGQSIGDALVVGSTLKILRGGVGAAEIDATGDGLDRAADLDAERHTRGDLDVGVMAKLGQRVKLGATVRNLTRPGFGTGSDRVWLNRQARTGMAVTGTSVAGFETVTVSADADLTKTPTRLGEVRHASAGGEAWARGHRFGIRGGVATNTVGERRTTFSTGVSVAPIKGLFIEAARITGEDDSLTGWTSTLRFAF